MHCPNWMCLSCNLKPSVIVCLSASVNAILLILIQVTTLLQVEPTFWVMDLESSQLSFTRFLGGLASSCFIVWHSRKIVFRTTVCSYIRCSYLLFCVIFRALHLSQLGLMPGWLAGWLAGRQTKSM